MFIEPLHVLNDVQYSYAARNKMLFTVRIKKNNICLFEGGKVLFEMKENEVFLTQMIQFMNSITFFSCCFFKINENDSHYKLINKTKICLRLGNYYETDPQKFNNIVMLMLYSNTLRTHLASYIYFYL
jgi:hypothetical protein